MNILKEILAEQFLIREDTSVDAINNAINNMHPAAIRYEGPTGRGIAKRLIYPVAYGISTAGNPVVRAFQPQGSTATEVPAWKFFRLDRIKQWRTINSRTFDPKELNGFNDQGDDQIETLYTISPIGPARPQTQRQVRPEKGKPEPEKVVTNHPVSKGEVDNGGADAKTEKQYYTANDVVSDILKTSKPKISPMTNQGVDNIAGQDYISKENQPAPATLPITKKDVGGATGEIEPEERDDELYANAGPVTKDDVGHENIEAPSLANSFKDLTNRMDGLYKDEEEKEL